MSPFAAAIQDILGPEGKLAQFLEGFEFRPSQLKMALDLMAAIQHKKGAIAEAGTGTGKTFAYLVPLILSDKKSVISTGTKNLQEQIYFKDLSLLKKAAGLSSHAVLMKGRKNYVCLERYHHYFSQAPMRDEARPDMKDRLDAWLQTTEFADRAEVSWLPEADTLWDLISASSDQCLGVECPYHDRCFLGRLRREAAGAKMIIVNHHLFFADMKVKAGGFGEIIPRFQVAVFDEAHQVEEVAAGYLGERISTRQLQELISDCQKEIRGPEGIENGGVGAALTEIQVGMAEMRDRLSRGEDRGSIDPERLGILRAGPGQRILKGLERVGREMPLNETNRSERQAILLRARDLGQGLELILNQQDSTWLTWYERRGKLVVLHATPLDISASLHELLYPKVQSTLFTSATLSAKGTFDYIRSRLGLREETHEAIYPSHFHFETQCMLYVPRDLPLPADPEFGPAAAGRVTEILKLSKGRALVLFTSYHNLNLVWERVKDQLPYDILRQGDAPRSVLLKAFREDIPSVLMATGSFWQGVDIPGEALSCLIMDKLPFASPTDPLVAARIDAVRRNGGNPFMEYQVPAAIIAFKQGMGRLIRSSADRGIMAVLDGRILSSPYGRHFLESLPPIPMGHHLSDIAEFFKSTPTTEVKNAPQAVGRRF
ncbi:MAG: ATP-dependent DNA helicase [Deltaproteobacteria bacterium]|nr:ATP-dependent DNA helicase [Deltaproteobacteria bacterium]